MRVEERKQTRGKKKVRIDEKEKREKTKGEKDKRQKVEMTK